MEELHLEQEFFAKLNRLSYEMRVPLVQGRNGNRRSAVKGASVEFSDYRDYQLGDDTRRIDWNVYGRFEKLYVKEFMEEKEAFVNIFLDTSGSMGIQTFQAKKSKLALELTLAFAYLVLHHLDRVKVRTIADGNQLEGRSFGGRSHFGTIVKELQQVEFKGTTNLTESIKKAALNTRGMSIVISDFLDPNGVEPLLRYLAYKKQEILFIQILAREEVKLEDSGMLELEEIETGQKLTVTITAREAKQYEQRVNEFLEKMKKISRRYGAMLCQVYSDETFDRVLLQHLGHLPFIRNRR